MDPKLTAVIVVAILILIILFWHQQGFVERLEGQPQTADPKSQPYIRLYESFGQKDLAYEFTPEIDFIAKTGRGFHKQILKISLKSVDINLPKSGSDVYDQLRKVEIWSIYGDDPNSSLESDFYNSYLEPDYVLRANPGKYKPVIQVFPGQHVKYDLTEPVKKIWLVAIL